MIINYINEGGLWECCCMRCWLEDHHLILLEPLTTLTRTPRTISSRSHSIIIKLQPVIILFVQVILEKTIRIPRSLSVKAASILKGDQWWECLRLLKCCCKVSSTRTRQTDWAATENQDLLRSWLMLSLRWEHHNYYFFILINYFRQLTGLCWSRSRFLLRIVPGWRVSETWQTFLQSSLMNQFISLQTIPASSATSTRLSLMVSSMSILCWWVRKTWCNCINNMHLIIVFHTMRETYFCNRKHLDIAFYREILPTS